MSQRPVFDARVDPLVKRFETYILAERNASENTREGYLSDIAQFAGFMWKDDVQVCGWKSVTDSDARRFVAELTKSGARATTVRRKLASLRTFFRYLQRTAEIEDNPFSLLRGPKKAKTVPRARCPRAI